MQPQCVFWDQGIEWRLQAISDREAGRTRSLRRELVAGGARLVSTSPLPAGQAPKIGAVSANLPHGLCGSPLSGPMGDVPFGHRHLTTATSWLAHGVASALTVS